MLQVKDLSISYGAIQAVRHVNFEVKKGEMFKSIVVVNDNIDLKFGTSSTSKGSYLLKKKEVYKTIKRIEKESDLNPFDEEQLQKVVNRIHIMSEEQNKAASLFKK